jgi:glycosyltransferase involved in cell wall biosynthesis
MSTAAASPHADAGRTAADAALPRPIRVLFVDYSIGFGGATKSMALTIRDIADVEPVILTSQHPDLRELWYGRWSVLTFRRWINYRTPWLIEDRLRSLRVPRFLRRFATRSVALLGVATSMVHAMRIVRIIRSRRIDILHLVNGFVPIDALLAARISRVPYIVHMRGFFHAEGGARRKAPAPPTLIIGCSAAVRDSYLQKSWFGSPGTILPDVVDMPRFDAAAPLREDCRRQWQLGADDVVVGIFGRVIQWKGQLEFVRAMLLALDTDPSLIGMIVGDASDGTETYFSELKQLIEASGKADRFRLTGYIADVEPLYAAADVVVHASIEPEPNGMVVQEAMAAGRPVIAADEGGPRELVRPGIDGYLVAPGDIDGLADAIRELARDPSMRQRMGEAARERARSLYDIPVAAARLRTVYEQVLAARAHPDAPVPPDWLLPASPASS